MVNGMETNSVIELLQKTKGNLVEENRMVESDISECMERLTRFKNRVTDNKKRIDEITEAISKLKSESEQQAPHKIFCSIF